MIFLIEEPLLFTQYTFHKQKILLHRASMQCYKDSHTKEGYKVVYVESNQIKTTQDIVLFLKKENITKVYLHDLVDNWLEKRLFSTLEKNNIIYEVHDTPLFLTSKKDLQ